LRHKQLCSILLVHGLLLLEQHRFNTWLLVAVVVAAVFMGVVAAARVVSVLLRVYL
jgi:hypothetical protein